MTKTTRQEQTEKRQQSRLAKRLKSRQRAKLDKNQMATSLYQACSGCGIVHVYTDMGLAPNGLFVCYRCEHLNK